MAKDIYIKGTDADWYEDVTFRVKDSYIDSRPKNLANYADDLIGTHMKLRGYNEYRKHSMQIVKQKNIYNKIEMFCYISLIILSITVIACLLL